MGLTRKIIDIFLPVVAASTTTLGGLLLLLAIARLGVLVECFVVPLFQKFIVLLLIIGAEHILLPLFKILLSLLIVPVHILSCCCCSLSLFFFVLLLILGIRLPLLLLSIIHFLQVFLSETKTFQVCFQSVVGLLQLLELFL